MILMKNDASEEIVIRRAKRGDFSRVFELISEAFPTEIDIAGFDPRRLGRLARLYSVLSVFFFLLDFLHVDFETILVAVANGKVVGELHLVPHSKRIWSLDSSAVDTKFRGRGIYRKLMQESLGYISKRHGDRIVTSLWTTNVPAVKITGELKFETFEEQTLMHRTEINGISPVEIKENTTIRELKQSDIEQVFNLFKSLTPKRTEVYNVAPKDFLGGSVSRLRNKVAGINSNQLVLVTEGKIVGYAKVTYTSPKEAGSIESFYALSSNHSAELTRYLLKYVLTFLASRNIRRVIVNLNKEWKETIETFERFGFKPVASVYEMVRWLT
jgi:ribosomal protein S18 acetylase RimI-like enzyme/L-amino acid N-acyltransferase YncA